VFSTRGKTPQELGGLARGRPTGEPKNKAPVRSSSREPSWRRAGEEARQVKGAAERGRGQHVSQEKSEGARVSDGSSAGLATGVRGNAKPTASRAAA